MLGKAERIGIAHAPQHTTSHENNGKTWEFGFKGFAV